jgi:hypothetical protein
MGGTCLVIFSICTGPTDRWWRRWDVIFMEL